VTSEGEGIEPEWLKATRTRDRRRPVPTGTTLQTTLLRDRLYLALESPSLPKTKCFEMRCRFGKEISTAAARLSKTDPSLETRLGMTILF